LLRRLLIVLLLGAPLCGCGDAATSDSPPGLLAVWGSSGRRAGQFVRPRAVAIGPDQKVYCVDMSGRIQVFGPDGRFRGSWLLPDFEVGYPEGLTVTPDGRLLVADTHYSRVLVYDASGELAFTFGAHGEEPGQFIYPLAVAVDDEGHIFVAEYGGRNDRIQVFTADGKFIRQLGSWGREPGQFQRPSGIDFDAAGNLYVADGVNHRVQKIAPDGTATVWGGTADQDGTGLFNFPYDVQVAPDGTVHVAEFGNSRLQRFSPDGDLIESWGGRGRRPGELWEPFGLAFFPDNTGLVADSQNHRLQKFRLAGPEVARAGP
jgi:DNA-binding beta-propeller fold protein YncE